MITVVQQAIVSSNPKTRYLAGMVFSGKIVISLIDYVWDLVVKQMFKIIPQV